MKKNYLPLYDTPITGVQYFGLDIIFGDEKIKPIDAVKIGSREYENTIFMIKRKENVQYKFDICCVKELLSEYVTGNNFSLRKRMVNNVSTDVVYGINIYDKLIHEYSENNQEIIEDVRLLHTIYEHKTIMVMRVRFLIDNKYLQNEGLLSEVKELEQMAFSLKYSQMKYLIDQDRYIIDQMIKTIYQLKNKEINVIKRLLASL